MRLEQELVGLLEEELLRRLVAEAIGPAAIDGRDRAIGLDVLAEREPHHALAVELGIGSGRRGFGGFGVTCCCRRHERKQDAEDKHGRYPVSSYSSLHGSLGPGKSRCTEKVGDKSAHFKQRYLAMTMF